MADLHTPLDEDELERLENILFEHGNDDSILSLSELDGFLTALISSPQAELPSRWIGWIWGGKDRQLAWATEEQATDFYNLLFRFQNTIADSLMRAPQDFEPLFMVNNLSEEEIFIAEDWCFGYMRGVDHLGWPAVPDALESWLFAIELHGRESNFDFLSTLSLEEHQNTVADIAEAAVRLFQYNRFGLIDGVAAPAGPVTSGKIGRNTPCPCGSGKKYKNCCLH